MGRISASVDIDAPLELCWAINADATRLTEWNPAILEVRDVSGPLDRVGTTYTGVIRAMGRRFDGRNQVIAVEPMRAVETDGTGVAGARARVRVEFERRGEGTRVTVTITFELPGGIFGGVAEKLFASRQLDEQLQASNAGFKRLAEREAGRAGGGAPAAPGDPSASAAPSAPSATSAPSALSAPSAPSAPSADR